MEADKSLRERGAVVNAERPLRAVLDEHAELRGLLRQLEAAGDAPLAAGLLDRLLRLLRTHFEGEESPGGLFDALRGSAPAATLERLATEHGAILASFGDLVRRLEAGPEGSLAEVRPDLRRLALRLREHDVTESRWLAASAPAIGAAPASARDVRSEALEINLERTAVDVVLPATHAVLLEATEHLEGVHENLRRLLREIHHPYVAWPETVEELHRRAMGDLPHFVSSPRAGEAVAVFCELYEKCAREARPAAARETALRGEIQYLEKVAREASDRLPDLGGILAEALGRLRSSIEGAAASALSARWKRLAGVLAADPRLRGEPLERCGSLLLEASRSACDKWHAVAESLAGRGERERSAGTPDLPPLGLASPAHLRECRDRAERLARTGGSLAAAIDALLSLPDEAEIERAYLEAASAFESPLRTPVENARARIRWLLRLLGKEALSAVHEQALFEIHRSVAEAIRGSDREAVCALVRECLGTLRRSGLGLTAPALHLVARIGREALASQDPEVAEVVVDEILEGEFPPPRFAGFTDEWQVRVDPAHLRAIRAYLSVIEASPARAQRLLAALVLHLRIGGAFVADTDLFQKDVSRLLHRPIGPVYHLVKQLLRLLPVFYDEIGAEGELREVSTRIDEIGGRRDPLCHFLRKQCHVEGNPLLPRFVEAIAAYWGTEDREGLRPFVPAALLDALEVEDTASDGVRAVFSGIARAEGIRALFDLEPTLSERRLAESGAGTPLDREKAQLLLRLHRLLRRKYTTDPTDLLERLRSSPAIPAALPRELEEALEAGRTERAIEILLEILEGLQRIVRSGERTEALEDIYRKRHVAAGIPSLYGRYREPKFDAMGLTLRVEARARALFERLFSEEAFEVVTRGTLRAVTRWLRLLLRALRLDGCRGRGLATGIAMLEEALDAEGFRLDQYVNLFQSLSHGTELLLRLRFLDVYEPVLERIGARLAGGSPPPGGATGDPDADRLRTSEGVLRDLVARSFAVQPLDNLVTRVLRALHQAKARHDGETQARLLAVDLERCFVPIRRGGPARAGAGREGALALGNKGTVIQRLAEEGFPVPEGFLLTTDLFRCGEALGACEGLRRAAARALRAELDRLEAATGLRFGSTSRPLLLSVRSSPVVSMPGILDTFLNVGLTVEIAEALAARPERAWSSWDAYRRFLQFWGMSRGIERDRFDGLLREAKRRQGVLKKSHLSADRMREIALAYRSLLLDGRIAVPEDPFEQLEACVSLVFRSWHAEKARLYRSRMQIADEWGMGVLVQRMVYGNLHERSGTGVALTCDPRRSTEDVRLVGDFVVQGQGDDVVSGLVETIPISEAQRASGSGVGERSLEKDFPRIYGALREHARALVLDQEMFHQEIEFTFEGDAPEDLYLLQSRDVVLPNAPEIAVFVPGESLERARIATGIGAAGGALSGRVAHTAADVADLRRRFPGESIVVLRPDTVPDDIPLILQADGMVTALGGATSHAAIAAQRLGRVCVVGCRALEVDEAAGRSVLAGRRIVTGDLLSIHGVDGSIYLGRHPATQVPQRRGFG